MPSGRPSKKYFTAVGSGGAIQSGCGGVLGHEFDGGSNVRSRPLDETALSLRNNQPLTGGAYRPMTQRIINAAPEAIHIVGFEGANIRRVVIDLRAKITLRSRLHCPSRWFITATWAAPHHQVCFVLSCARRCKRNTLVTGRINQQDVMITNPRRLNDGVTGRACKRVRDHAIAAKQGVEQR